MFSESKKRKLLEKAANEIHKEQEEKTKKAAEQIKSFKFEYRPASVLIQNQLFFPPSHCATIRTETIMKTPPSPLLNERLLIENNSTTNLPLVESVEKTASNQPHHHSKNP